MSYHTPQIKIPYSPENNTTELPFSRFACLPSYISFMVAWIIIILGMHFTIHMIVIPGKVLNRKQRNELLMNPTF